MGQSLLKLTPGNEVTKSKLDEIAGKCYEDFSNMLNNKDLTEPELFCEFYRAVCETVEEINSSVGNTQFRLPKEEVLRKAFETHHKGKERLSEQEFQKILQDAIMETGFTGIGAKDVILYIFGVPATTFLIKKGVFPRAIPDGFFIPAVTSATVFALSKFNKI
ncbi:uncharacterized protein LOC110711647 [Chenopodium quinoa]|uniref:Uncharacterized protein n=1 Tax=Chenopodium quinoa TaxID=63459 RepID=A0A803LT02_CHEQI|nr:uncharacterized protein LOC110711647 [Chenopodium quinoa]